MAKASDYDPSEQPRLTDGTYTFKRYREARPDDLGLFSRATRDDTFLDRTLGSVERHAALLNGGHVEAIALAAVTDPRSRAGIDEAWAQGVLAAQHTPDATGYPFPALVEEQRDGKRRPRRNYDVDGWNLRPLGSVAAIRRDCAKYGRHQVVAAVRTPEGQTAELAFLVEKAGPGNYSVTCISKNAGEKGEQAAYALQAAMEAQRVTAIPRHVEGLAARAKERIRAEGIGTNARLTSTWIDSVGYTEDDREPGGGVMVTKTSKGGVYGHTVSREVFERLRTSEKPGAVFNQLVRKGQGVRPVAVEECRRCKRVYSASRVHKCPAPNSAAPTVPQISNQVSRNAAIAMAAGAVSIRKRAQERLALAASGPPTS